MISSIDELERTPDRFLCVLCDRPTVLCCSNCRKVFYCSESHQLQHWATHAQECDNLDSSSEFDDSQSSLHEAVELEQDPDNSALADETVYKERQSLRAEAIAYLCEGNASTATSKLRAHFTRAQAEYERNRWYDIYELLADGLLLAKAYIQNDELNLARSVLVNLGARLVSHSTTHNLHPAAAFRSDEGKEVKASLNYAQLKRKLSVYAVLSNMLQVCGDEATAERMLVQYCKLVEVHLGPRSLEASNCCFMLGLFYIKRALCKKALECFRRASEIRAENCGEMHETVGDCQYNLGLLHRRLGNSFKANACLQKALEIRMVTCSENSLPTAQVLEALGVLYMEQKDFRNAYEKLGDCYQIRKKLLKHSDDHSELTRITESLATLNQMVDEEAKKDHFKRLELSKFKLGEVSSPEKSAGFRV